MAKTSCILISATLPTTDVKEIQDFIGKVITNAKNAGAVTKPDFAISTRPILGFMQSEGTENERMGRSRTDEDRSEEAAADRDEDGDDEGAERTVKRGRGRPRKSDAGAGEAGSRSSEGGRKRQRDDDAEDGEGVERNVTKRTRKGDDEGNREDEGRSRSSGRAGNDQRGNRKASRVKDEDEGEGWDEDEAEGDDDDEREAAAKSKDPWPNNLTPKDITKDVIASLLGKHHAATGAKSRDLTFDLLEDVTGERTLAKVSEDDYRKLAKALLKDAARYEFGLQKATKAKREDDDND